MAINIKEQLNRIVERKNKATQLDNLIQGYKLYARTEGKSKKTITITTTAVTTFKEFLETKGFSEQSIGGRKADCPLPAAGR